jgi:hypothetical protein
MISALNRLGAVATVPAARRYGLSHSLQVTSRNSGEKPAGPRFSSAASHPARADNLARSHRLGVVGPAAISKTLQIGSTPCAARRRFARSTLNHACRYEVA